MDIYQEDIIDHAKHPRNVGIPADATHLAAADNPLCGDRLELGITEKKGTISAIGFDGRGCAISQASASKLFESMKGRSVADAKKVTKEDVVALLGIPLSPTRLKCAWLSWEVLVKTLNAPVA